MWWIAGTWNRKTTCFKYLEDILYISYFKFQKISDVQYHIHQPPQTSILSKPASGGQQQLKNRTVCCIHQRWVSLLTNWCTTLSDHFLACLKILGVREWNNSQGCRKSTTHHNTAIYMHVYIYIVSSYYQDQSKTILCYILQIKKWETIKLWKWKFLDFHTHTTQNTIEQTSHV